MALKAGRYGIKKVLIEKLFKLPVFSAIGTGLQINSDGELEATGATMTIEPNPEGDATESLEKLQIGDTIYGVNDNTNCYQTDDDTETAIVDADYVPFYDASASAPKKSTWSNFVSKIQAKLTAFVDWVSYTITGAHNLLIQDYVSKSLHGITFDVKDDGKVAVYGRATADVSLILHTCNGKESYLGKNVTLSGCPSGGSGSTYFINAYRIASQDGSTGTIYDTGTGQTFDFLNDASGTVGTISISIINGTDMGTEENPTVFEPMIRLSSDKNSNYAPGTMTNRELTKIVQGIETVGTLVANSSLNDYYKTGDYYSNTGSNTATLVNKPSDVTGAFRLSVICGDFPLGQGSNSETVPITQKIELINGATPAIYMRHKPGSVGASFGSWYKFTGTELS